MTLPGTIHLGSNSLVRITLTRRVTRPVLNAQNLLLMRLVNLMCFTRINNTI